MDSSTVVSPCLVMGHYDNVCNCKDKSLLKVIKLQFSNSSMQLVLSNESIVPTEDLFYLLFKEVAELLLDSTKSYVQDVLAIQNFCIQWVLANNATILMAKAREYINGIIQMTSPNMHIAIAKKSGNLKQACLDVHQTTSEYLFGITPQLLSKQTESFTSILEKLYKKRLNSDYNKIVDQITDDLLLHQVKMCQALVPADLIKNKWDPSDSSLTLYLKKTEQLFLYVVDIILRCECVNNRERLIKFFLNIARSALGKNDFVSACSIYCAISHGAIKCLKKTWELVDANKEYINIKLELNDYFWGTGNFATLRERMKICEEKKLLYVPCIEIYLKDIDKIEESPKIIKEQYNLDKLQMIHNAVSGYFSPRESWYQYDKASSYYNTTIISDLLENYMPTDDDERYHIARRLDQ